MFRGQSFVSKIFAGTILFSSLFQTDAAFGAPRPDSKWTHWGNCSTFVYADSDGLYMSMRGVGYQRISNWTDLGNGDILATFKEGGKTVNVIYYPRSTYAQGKCG